VREWATSGPGTDAELPQVDPEPQNDTPHAA